MLTKVFAGLIAVAALSYGGVALYRGGCPFSGGNCASRCSGAQETASPSSCTTESGSPSCCEQSEAGCCESEIVTAGLVGVCGSAIVSEQQSGGTCPAQSNAVTSTTVPQ